MQFETEHAVLLGAANSLLAPLRNFRSHIVPGRVGHMQHDDFAERALSLNVYLASAIDLAARDQYLPAFAILRSALEHHLTDRLLFLATRYKQVFTDVKKLTYEEWLQGLQAKKPGTENIISIDYDTNKMTIIRSGLHESGGRTGPRRRTISIYYFLLQEFNPFVGRAQSRSTSLRAPAPFRAELIMRPSSNSSTAGAFDGIG